MGKIIRQCDNCMFRKKMRYKCISCGSEFCKDCGAENFGECLICDSHLEEINN